MTPPVVTCKLVFVHSEWIIIGVAASRRNFGKIFYRVPNISSRFVSATKLTRLSWRISRMVNLKIPFVWKSWCISFFTKRAKMYFFFTKWEKMMRNIEPYVCHQFTTRLALAGNFLGKTTQSHTFEITIALLVNWNLYMMTNTSSNMSFMNHIFCKCKSARDNCIWLIQTRCQIDQHWNVYAICVRGGDSSSVLQKVKKNWHKVLRKT